MDDTKHLSKAERKELKRERKEQEKLEREKKWRTEKRNKKLKFWGKIFLVIAIIAVARGLWIANGPRIQITPLEYEFGQVSVRGGTVNTTMTVRNTGKTDLVIKEMETSCMCTTATLVVNGREGPRFGMKMHGTNPRGWSARIPPGGEAQLRVYYDPRVHKDFRGYVTRTITVSSNSPFSWKKIATIRADQVS